jgi:excisionase family DNA binding protein
MATDCRPRRWLKVEEVAEITGWHPETVRKRLRLKELRGSKRAKTWHVHQDDLDAWFRVHANRR